MTNINIISLVKQIKHLLKESKKIGQKPLKIRKHLKIK